MKTNNPLGLCSLRKDTEPKAGPEDKAIPTEKWICCRRGVSHLSRSEFRDLDNVDTAQGLHRRQYLNDIQDRQKLCVRQWPEGLIDTSIDSNKGPVATLLSLTASSR